MKTLVLIPCYNEAKSVEAVVNSVKKDNPGVDYLVMNDCSTDNTLQICVENNFNYINLPINLGIGGCVQAGYKYAYENNYDIAIQLDGDGQHDPSYINSLILPIINKQADFTIGSRFIDNKGFQSTKSRRFGISMLSFLIKICSGTKIKDVTSGFRAVNRKYIKIFAKKYAQDYPEPEAIMEATLHGAKIVEVPVVMYERNNGTSSIRALMSAYYMIKVSLSIILFGLTSKKPREG